MFVQNLKPGGWKQKKMLKNCWKQRSCSNSVVESKKVAQKS